MVYGATDKLLLQTNAYGVLHQIYVSIVTFKLYNDIKTQFIYTKCVFYTYNRCALPEHDPKRVETLWSFNMLIVYYMCHNIVDFVGVVFVITL